jgi:hypothetical protein
MQAAVHQTNGTASIVLDPFDGMSAEMRKLAERAIYERYPILIEYSIGYTPVQFHTVKAVFPDLIVRQGLYGCLECQQTLSTSNYAWTLHGNPVALPADVAYQINYNRPLTGLISAVQIDVTATSTDGVQQRVTYMGFINRPMPAIPVYLSQHIMT